jgi:hypothetical protein
MPASDEDRPQEYHDCFGFHKKQPETYYDPKYLLTELWSATASPFTQPPPLAIHAAPPPSLGLPYLTSVAFFLQLIREATVWRHHKERLRRI